MNTAARPARPESTNHWRAPSVYGKCRRKHCQQPPVADLCRTRHNYRTGQTQNSWWAYCAEHLRVYNREVRGDTVWWLG